MSLYSFAKLNCLFKKCALSSTVRAYPLKFSLRTFKRQVFKKELTIKPDVQKTPSNEFNRFSIFIRGLTFTGGVCGVCYIGSTIAEYEGKRKSKDDYTLSWIQEKWNQMEGYNLKEGSLRKQMNQWWNELSDGQRVFWAIFATNLLVFLCWKHPALQNTMQKYFLSSPFGTLVCWPMLSSTFSHYALLHLGLNMYVLHSFSFPVCSSLGKEQFMAFYLAGGVMSSFSSHIIQLLRFTKGYSLGASGAIMALLGYCCTKYPNAQLSVIFIPNYTFDAEIALKGVMLLDFLGILFKWRLFDHAAHLGGAVFGLLYSIFGENYIWNKRGYVIDTWKDYRHLILDDTKRNK